MHARTLGDLEFTPCDLPSAGAGMVEAECATFAVHEDPDNAKSRVIDLALALVPSRNSQPLPDPVVLLAGGPGQSAREAYALMRPAFELLRRERHVLLVDQRGTGQSNPLHCKRDADAIDLFAAADIAEARQFAADCRDALEPIADLRQYTTTRYLQDLEAVRAAMKIPRYNLVGGSYGTRVALEYMRRHPDALRSVVLASVVPPELILPGEHARNLDAALDDLFGRCRDATACAERFGDPAQTLAKLRERVAQGVWTVAVPDPRRQEMTSLPLNRDVLRMTVRLLAYGAESASLLPFLLDEAIQGRPQPLAAQGLMVLDTLFDVIAHGMELSVMCSEDVPLLPDAHDDSATFLGNDFIRVTRAQCEVWPRGSVPDDFHEPVNSDLPVLILSGETDPVTPPRYADAVAKTLANHVALLAPGQGHTPVSVGCVPELIDTFITSADPKAVDPGCLEPLGPPPFFVDFNGPAP